jgi:hypothetical protein
LRCARFCCGMLRQAVLTLSPSLHLVQRPVVPTGASPSPGGRDSKWKNLFLAASSTGTKMRVGLPLFPVRKSIGEPESAVMHNAEARPRPQVRNGRISTQALAFSAS